MTTAVEEGRSYTIGIMGYHVNNCTAYLSLTPDELRASGKTKVVTTSAQEVMEEYLRNHQNIGRRVEGRLVWV
jgi:5'-nucleotidase